MTSNSHPDHDRSSLHRAGAGVLAASIAAAAIVAVLTLMQSAPGGVQSTAPPGAHHASLRDASEPLDADVDWNRVEQAPEPDGASVAAYER